MAKIIEALVPPKGWHYPQKFNETEIELRGYDLNDLLRTVVRFRIENKLVVGDVYTDVENYICQFQNQCNDKYDPEKATKYEQFTSIATRWIDRILEWGRSIIDGSPHLVSEELQEERMRYCRKCPHAESWRGQCSSCVSSAKAMFVLITQGRIDNREIGCRKYNFDCATACSLEERFLPKKDPVPEECWRNK